MGKKKKKGGGYRVAATVAVMAVASTLAACTPIASLFHPDTAPADPGAMPVIPADPSTPAVVTNTALEVTTWVLAALGLGPLSRIVMASRPLVTKVVELLVGKPKVAAPKPAS